MEAVEPLIRAIGTTLAAYEHVPENADKSTLTALHGLLDAAIKQAIEDAKKDAQI